MQYHWTHCLLGESLPSRVLFRAGAPAWLKLLPAAPANKAVRAELFTTGRLAVVCRQCHGGLVGQRFSLAESRKLYRVHELLLPTKGELFSRLQQR